MPIYEYQCPKHGKFAQFFRNFADAEIAKDSLLCDKGTCGELAPRIPSLPSMQPDRHWNGTQVGNEFVTSAKEFKQKTKNFDLATRNNQEWSQKRKGVVIKEKEEKLEKNVEKYVADIVAAA